MEAYSLLYFVKGKALGEGGLKNSYRYSTNLVCKQYTAVALQAYLYSLKGNSLGKGAIVTLLLHCP